MKENSEKFYKELDEHRAHASCCTCQTLVIFFSLILIVLIFLTVYLFWRFNQEKSKIVQLPQKITNEILSKQFKISTGEMGSVEIPVDDNSLSKLLNSGFSFDNFTIKDIQTIINPNEVIIIGKLLSPINTKLVISVVPQVKDGKIDLSVKSVRSGSLTWPDFLAKTLTNNLKNFFNQKFWLINQTINLETIELQDGKMILKGKVK